MGFCTEECRNVYFLDYMYRLTMAMKADQERGKEAGGGTVTTEEQGVGHRCMCIFFACAEV
jgi:hypothetical protein